MINLIYLLPSEKKPSGGIKVALQHSEIINKFKNKFSSKIIFISKKKTSKWKNSIDKLINLKKVEKYNGWKFNQIKIDNNNKTKWFDNNINLKNNFKLDKKKDFVILPEIFAHFAKDFLIKNNIKYGIFVQNGHALDFTNDYKTLNLVYSEAKFIFTVSSHINQCVETAFPKCNNKIFKISPYVRQLRLDYKDKSKLITYMPRKLSDHSKLVLFFLKKHLPKKWKILPLEKMDEKTIFRNLKKSKIFLSFSNLEGFGLPPLEAGTLGNIVIGYTGTAGKEYWNLPIFKKIEQGDILKFVKEIKVATLSKFNNVSINNHRLKLLNKYSEKNQEKRIIKMLNKIKKVL